MQIMTPQPVTSLAAQADDATSLLKKKRPADMEKINAVAKDFESQFISQMLESMFATIDPENALGGNESEETFRSMMITEYGKVITKAGGLGVADQIKREMLKLQEIG